MTARPITSFRQGEAIPKHPACRRLNEAIISNIIEICTISGVTIHQCFDQAGIPRADQGLYIGSNKYLPADIVHHIAVVLNVSSETVLRGVEKIGEGDDVL